MKIQIVKNDCPITFIRTERLVAADYLAIVGEIIELLHGHEETWKGHKIPKCYKVGIMKEEDLVFEIDTRTASGPDYISFFDSLIKLFQSEQEHLEKEANASGQTIRHSKFHIFGSRPLENVECFDNPSPKDPE